MESKFNGINYPIEFMRVAGVILITFTHIRHDFTDGAPYFILETIPKYGTLLLSVISGYLFCMNPYPGRNLLKKKINSLFIPFIIANLAVLIPVLILHFFGYDYLNRLEYNSVLITEGLFSLSSSPINPPTYFIRDLFIIFCLIALLRKNYWSLLFILPLLFFGKLILRWDIFYLFITGFIIRKYALEEKNKIIINTIGALLIIISLYVFKEKELHRHAIAVFIFINVVTLKFKFVTTGAYTYLLHLYHTPIMIFLFPILHAIYPQPYFETVAQISLSLFFCYIFFLIIRRFKLMFMVGNRN